MTPFARDNLSPALTGKKILLGISGSIAAFKAHDVIRHLRACGAEVRVVLTDSAEKFVTRVTLETLSGQPVLNSLWGEAGAHGTHHIDTARWADLALVAPATANTIAKLALGLADDLLTTELLAATCPLFVAPAMNPVMYAHPAVQANVETLRKRGATILGPAAGLMACGEEGLGRMLEPDAIVEAVGQAFFAKPTGRRAVVTLGPTRSRLDPVRYLTNRSSGLMGAALVWSLKRAGYDVTAVAGPTDAELPAGVTVKRVETAEEMATVALSAWADVADVFVGAAAVLDWDVANPAAQKLKKEGGETPRLDFKRNVDILAEAVRLKRGRQFVLGFAAETSQPLQYGRAKLVAKGCDALFVNDVSRAGQGFEASANGGWWLSSDLETAYELKLRDKARLASDLVGLIEGRVPSDALALDLSSDQHTLAAPTTPNGGPDVRAH